ncbi:MAG: DUF2254 domain-containing protein [Phycisphaerales bacterium]|nr:DUF2254 domain-containing protein [Phycisphaerales bacterium]
MLHRLRFRLENIRNSYWFLPGLLLLAAAIVARISYHIDRALNSGSLDERWWMPDIKAGPAQAVLASIAGASVSLASLVFSITLVVLTLTAGQYGSRILRRFMTDRITQFVLGLYTATFVYCLLVLLSIHRVDDAAFAPRTGVAGAILLAVLDIGVLTFFIHHISLSIQASNMVDSVARDLDAAIRDMFPDELSDTAEEPPAPAQPPPADFDDRLVRVFPESPSYIRNTDFHGLVRAASELDLVVRIPRVGEFVGPVPLMEVYPADRVDQPARARLRDCMILGPTRTPVQDIEYCVDRLVEIAARALSPAINDPFTAVTCIHHLGAAAAKLAGRSEPPRFHADDAGRTRVITDTLTFQEVLSHGYDPIRQYGAGQIIVTKHLFLSLSAVALSTHDPVRLRAVRALMDRVWLTCRRDQSEDPQLPVIKSAHARAMAVVPVPETESEEAREGEVAPAPPRASNSPADSAATSADRPSVRSSPRSA